MELKLVYRVLRKISDWTIAGFYSEVYVEGQENVHPDGPLIIASTHHNEIIDIATLAATIPHRRHLSFWAKSSMFAHPTTRAILLSSGAIPVTRNPNNDNGNGNGSTSSSYPAAASTLQTSSPQGATNGNGTTLPQASLFRDTSNALAAGRVVGVFPEGTSYTQPGIAQVLPGAARAAVEYVRWVKGKGARAAGENGKADGKEEGIERELTIVPVAIVYTDKPRYLSRIVVGYGKPVVPSKYMDDGGDIAARGAVKRIMGEVERQMKEMSVNAPDWDTLYAANMAREILWEDENSIPLKDWVGVSQSLVSLFTRSANPTPQEIAALNAVTRSLTKYYSLLRHTDIKHSILDSLLPSTDIAGLPTNNPLRIITTTITALPRTLLSLILFTPPLLLHIPAYVTGTLAGRLLAARRDDETKAQYKAVGGGVGLGLGVGVGFLLVRRGQWMDVVLRGVGLSVTRCLEMVLGAERISWAERVLGKGGALGWMGSALGIYAGVWVMVRWHNALVDGNYRRLRTLLTLYKVFTGLLLPHIPLSTAELCEYTKPPAPPRNSYIKFSVSASGTEPKPTTSTGEMGLGPKMIGSRRLIRPLLEARGEAVRALGAFLREREREREDGEEDVVKFLRGRGARVP